MKKLIKQHSEKIRFVLVGGTNTAIDFGILFGLTNLTSLSIFYSNIVSTSAALTFSFFANKKFTFKNNNGKTNTQLLRFLAITLTGLWIIQPIIIAMADVLFFHSVGKNNTMLLAGKLLASCFTLFWNYFMYKKFVFINISKNTNKE